MRPLVLLALLSSAASATPMLQKCRSVAPLICGLTDASTNDEILACFGETNPPSGRPDASDCASELGHARVHKACDGADVPRVCKGVKPGNDRLMTCLRKNRKRLGPACRKALDAYDEVFADPDSKQLKRSKHAGVGAVRC